MTSSVGTQGPMSDQPLGQQAEFLAEKIGEVRREISKAIVGQREVVDGVLMALWRADTCCWKARRGSEKPCSCGRSRKPWR